MIETDLKAARARIKAQLDALDTAIAAAEVTRPAEPEFAWNQTNHVLTFTKHFGSSEGPAYAYAAIGYQKTLRRKETLAEPGLVGYRWVEEAVNRWAVTGQEDLRALTWAQLLAWVEKDEGVYAADALSTLASWNYGQSLT